MLFYENVFRNQFFLICCCFFRESTGFAVAYAYSSNLCVSVKLYLLLGYLTVGMFCYLAIELLENSAKKLTIQAF